MSPISPTACQVMRKFIIERNIPDASGYNDSPTSAASKKTSFATQPDFSCIRQVTSRTELHADFSATSTFEAMRPIVTPSSLSSPRSSVIAFRNSACFSSGNARSCGAMGVE